MATSVLYLLPGLLCDETIWAAQIEALSGRYDVRVPSFRYGDSLTSFAASVLAEAPKRFALAGHSMGGRVALQIAREAPERVERLALLDTGVHGVHPGEHGTRGALVELADTWGMQALAERWLPPMVLAERHEDAALMGQLFAMVGRMTPTIFAAQTHALLGRPDASGWLPAISCPTLVGVGDQDQWSPPAQHERIARSLPHATLALFPRSGHMAPVEAPRAVIAALDSWLDS